jgi:hypothetical protein
MFLEWARSIAEQIRYSDSNRYLSYHWLEEVASTPDTELRSHRIALTYAKYAVFLNHEIFGHRQKAEGTDGATNANWFHFSTWAALSVSRNIGNVAAPQRFDNWPNVLRQTVAPYIVRTRGVDHQRVSQELAAAQRLIFVHTCAAFLDSIGMPQKGNLELQGDIFRLARAGFDFYKKANHAAENLQLQERYVLLGNIFSTLVEQRLIDHQLAAVIDAVPNRFTQVAGGRVGQVLARFAGYPRQVTALTLADRLEPVRATATEVWGRLLTEQVFVMALPGEMLRVGRDVPPYDPGKPYYPQSLRWPAEFVGSGNEENQDMALLRSLIVRFDRTTGDGVGSRAHDWRRYDERMNWAVSLLRSRQQDESMFWPPYSEEDEAAIWSGRLPRGSGDASKLVPPLNNTLYTGGKK